jgi:hypothetical protein
MGSKEGAKVSANPLEPQRASHPEVFGFIVSGAVFTGRSLYLRGVVLHFARHSRLSGAVSPASRAGWSCA